MPTTDHDRVAEATAARDAAVRQLDTIKAQHAAACADLKAAEAHAAMAVLTGDDAAALQAVQLATVKVAALTTAISNAEEAVERAARNIVAEKEAGRAMALRAAVARLEAAGAEADAALAALAPTLAAVRDAFNECVRLAPSHIRSYGGPSLYLALGARGRLMGLLGDDLLATRGTPHPQGSVTAVVTSAARQFAP